MGRDTDYQRHRPFIVPFSVILLLGSRSTKDYYEITRLDYNVDSAERSAFSVLMRRMSSR